MLLEGVLTTLLGSLSASALQKRREAEVFRRTEAAARAREERAERFQAALNTQDAVRQHLQAIDRDRMNADRAVRDAEHLEMVRFRLARALRHEERAEAHNPFVHDTDTVLKYLRAAGEDGKAPVLLFAPIAGESAEDGHRSFRVGLRKGWQAQPWAGDARSLDGFFRRPLTHTDLDLLVVRETVPDLPVILVHGELQTARRLWVSISAWGLTGDADTRVDFHLPRLTVPESGDDDALLEFQDALAHVCGVVAGVLAEWHRLIGAGIPPRIHRLVKDPEERRWVGVANATGYEFAAAHGAIGSRQASFWQSVILADSGLPEAAAANIDDETLDLVAAAAGSDAETVNGLRSLAAALVSIGDGERAARITRLVDAAALRAMTQGPSPLRTW